MPSRNADSKILIHLTNANAIIIFEHANDKFQTTNLNKNFSFYANVKFYLIKHDASSNLHVMWHLTYYVICHVNKSLHINN